MIHKSSQSKSEGGSTDWAPKQRYRGRCIDTKLGTSGGGHRMTTLTCEIIDDTITLDEKEYDVAGRQFRLFLMHVQKESWGQARVEAFCRKLALPIEESDDGIGGTEMLYDDEKHELYFKGMEFDIVLHPEEQVKRMDKKAGEKEGKPILDGEGHEIKDGWRLVGGIDDVPSHCAPNRNMTVAKQPF